MAEEQLDETFQGNTAQLEPTAPVAFGLYVVYSTDREAAGRFVLCEDRLGVGRSPGSHIGLLIRDRRLSRQHAVLVPHKDNGTFTLQDLDSSNGTYVNGERIQTRVLAENDVIRLGGNVLVFAPAPHPDSEPDPVCVGGSPSFLQVLTSARAIAASDLSVLLLGETGSGKDAVARRIHELSGRAGEMVAINCASIPADLAESTLFGHKKGAFTGATTDSEGVFGRARNGTLFLDEVGTLPLGQQAKLLRVLENEEFIPVGAAKPEQSRARIIAATNADLGAEVTAGAFREDLYARLSGYVLRMPPLRARKSDIFLLAQHFMATFDVDNHWRFSAGFVEELLTYQWPRNVRELRTVLRRLALSVSPETLLTRQHVRDAIQDPADISASRMQSARGDSDASPNRESLARDLQAAGGSVPRLAKLYDKHPKQMYRMLERYGLYERSAQPAQRPGRDELLDILRAVKGNVQQVAKHFGKDSKQVYRWLQRYDVEVNEFRKSANNETDS